MTRRWNLSRLLLIPLALLISIAVPLAARQQVMLLLLGALVAAAGGILLLLNPAIGFAGLIVASHFVPFEIGTGTQTGLNIVVLLIGAFTGVWLMEQFFIQRKVSLLPSATFLPLLLFCAAAVFSFLVGQLRWYPAGGAPLRAQLGGLAIYLLSACTYIVFAHQIRSISWLKRLCWIFIGMGAIFMVCTFYLDWISPALTSRVGFLFRRGTSGSVFWIWFTVLPFGQVLHNRKLKPVWKAVLAAILVGIFYYRGITTTDWTSGWVPALVGIIALLLITDVRLAAVMLVSGFILVPLIGWELYNRYILTGDNIYSLSTRLEAIWVMLDLIKVGPIFGFGPANYYWYTPFFNIMGYYVSFNSHNNYLDLLAQTGIVSLVFFFWFFFLVGRLGWRLYTTAQDGFIKGYSAACIAAIPATFASAALGDWVIPFTYNIGMSGLRSSVFTWLFLAGLVVIEHQLARKPTASEEAPL